MNLKLFISGKYLSVGWIILYLAGIYLTGHLTAQPMGDTCTGLLAPGAGQWLAPTLLNRLLNALIVLAGGVLLLRINNRFSLIQRHTLLPFLFFLLFEAVRVKAVSHITGGGFYENIPRSIPKGFGAKIDKSALRILPVFDIIKREGNVPERDMFNTFNMGVGMSVVVAAEDAEKALSVLRAAGEDAYVIGEVVASEDGVIIK